MLDDMKTYLLHARERQLAELCDWLQIPSISTLPAHKLDVHDAAYWLARHLKQIGLDHVEVIETETHPLVRADWLHAGPDKPTILVYGHFDVQPVDPIDKWETPPFAPSVRMGPHGPDLFARGASDDKGQTFVHVKALEALLATQDRLPVNIRLLVEGEEESGSTAIRRYVPENVGNLAADVVLVSDTHILSPDRPVLVYGLRGIWTAEITVSGPATDLHSGSYGGVVHNPNQALCEMLAALHDKEGRVTVPGFYDNVRTISVSERSRLANVPYAEDDVRNESGVPAVYGETGFSVVERTGARPTLEINGIWGGFIEEGFKTVIPAEAHAKISCRLVPNQDPARIGNLVAEHLRELAPPTVSVEIRAHHGSDAFFTDLGSPAMKAAATAYQRSFGVQPLYMLEGGGIPIVKVFEEVLGASVVLMGFGLPDDNLHAPNEKIHLPNFYRGIETSVHFFNLLGDNGYTAPKT